MLNFGDRAMRKILAEKTQTKSGGWMLKVYQFVKGNDSEIILILFDWYTHAKWML